MHCLPRHIFLLTWIVGAPAELEGSLIVQPAHPGISVAFWFGYELHPTEIQNIRLK